MATKYSDNSIFQDKDVNSLIDIIFSKMEIDYPPAIPADPNNDFIFKSVVLSGQVAAKMQSSFPDTPKNIAFEISTDVLFLWLQKNLSAIPNGRVLKFSNATFLYVNNVYLEFWAAASTKAMLIENVYVQDLTFIAPNLL